MRAARARAAIMAMRRVRCAGCDASAVRHAPVPLARPLPLRAASRAIRARPSARPALRPSTPSPVPREVTDADGVTWSCTPAYAGLASDGAMPEAARVEGTDRYAVVCTPSGGAQTVRLEVPADWETAMDDAALLAAIDAARDGA